MDRWKQLEELFHAALAQPRDQRLEYLYQACPDDAEIRSEVLSLLRRADDDSFLVRLPLAARERANRVLVGQTLGNFQIVALIGRGGMGEVYRARDTRLNREVAIKVADEAFSNRFEREAQAVAALNHPNICTLHDVGPNYLVMELVEGPTLADKIRIGAIPLDEALKIARQIAEALEAAHEKGIVHRDLKPANIKLTTDGTVKVLDFGLATTTPNVALASPENSPTVTTQTGLVAGTPAYMSPEQAEGKSLDKRADIWSFGVVFWEMLTGKRLFQGNSVTEILTNVLTADIDYSKLPRDSPTSICDLVQRCLDRNPKMRLRDIGEARVSIERCEARSPSGVQTVQTSLSPAETGRTRRRGWTLKAATGTAALLAVLVAFFFFDRTKTLPRPQKWTQITDFPDSATAPSLSRDGRMLAFTRGDGWFMKKNEVYVKILPDGPAVPLTQDRSTKCSPVFSPDGSLIAYTGGGFHTWIVPVFAGGAPQPMLERAAGLTWIDSKRILFSENTDHGMVLKTALESGAEERQIYLPVPRGMAHFSSLSPDGKQLLVVEMTGPGPFIPCRLVPFDGSSRGRQVGPIPSKCTAAAWSADGKWMYFTADAGNGSHIWRQRMDRNRPEQMSFGPTEELGLAIAPDGRSLFTSAGTLHDTVWLHDTGGDRQISAEGSPSYPIISPDGSRVYFTIESQLWAVDVKTGKREQVLPGTTITGFSLSPDGKSLIYGLPDRSTWMEAFDRQSSPQRLPVENAIGVQLGRSGRLYFTLPEGGTTYLFSTSRDGRDRKKILSQATEHEVAEISPDERWAVWRRRTTNVVEAWPLLGERPITVCFICGKVTWSRDGKEILYTFRAMRGEAGVTVAVPLKTGETFPPLPQGSVHAMSDVTKLTGAVVIPYESADVGPAQSFYAYRRETFQQNIFQVPLP